MNEQMKAAWLEISQMLGEPTREELDVFLRTWQRAIQAEREACEKVCDDLYRVWCSTDDDHIDPPDALDCKRAIRARGQA
jgi:hypothetical protein